MTAPFLHQDQRHGSRPCRLCSTTGTIPALQKWFGGLRAFILLNRTMRKPSPRSRRTKEEATRLLSLPAHDQEPRVHPSPLL